MKFLIIIFFSLLGLLPQNSEKETLKKEALVVLQTKCNVCHVKNNPNKFFTTYNIYNLAPKIHKQVFVKKRMPKGKEVKLTADEYTTLKNWIESLSNENQNGN